MFKIRLSRVRTILLFVLVSIFAINGYGQTSMPPELSNNSIKEQLNYLEQKTRIYENYRAIREDMFQKIKINISDTLTANKNNTILLKNQKTEFKGAIDSLSTELESTKASLSDMTRTKNSIKVIGIEVNKTSYNSVMWIIVTGLIAILGIGLLAFKRNIILTSSRKKELDDIKIEFETYRKTTREAREKMSMEHFKEIQRLKGVQ